MSDASDDNRWSWVTPDGKTITGAKGELMLALRGEKLPAATLVWRSGWGEWLPASRVAELRNVLPPGKAEPLQAPKIAERAVGRGQPAPGTARAPSPQPIPTLQGVGPAAPVRPETSRPPPAPIRQPKLQAAIGPAPAVASQPPPAPVRGATSRPPPAPARGAKNSVARAEVTAPRAQHAPGPAAQAPAETRPRGASMLGPPREELVNSAPPRGPLPTLGEDFGEERMATLRPPGAVPPPPRAVAPLLTTPTPKLDDEQPTQRHLPPPSAAVPTTVPNAHTAAPTELVPVAAMLAARPVTPKVIEPPKDLDATLGSTPFDRRRLPEVPAPSTTLESAEPSANPATETKSGPRDELSWTLPIPRSVGIVLAVFLSGVLLLGGGALVFSPHHGAATEASAAASAAPVLADAPGCRLLAPAARLATTVERSVQPALTEVAPGEIVAVGFAAAPKTAAGALVRLDTLDAERRPDQSGDAAVRSNAPVVKHGSASFVADRAGGDLGGARTLSDGTTVGFAGPDLVRRSNGKSTLLVAGAASEKTTDPRVGTGTAGTLVTFRRGGLSGEVLYTWIGPEGPVDTSLTPVAVPNVKFAGTPDAAANGTGGLVAFAGRASETADWRVELVSVPLRGKSSAKPFAPPPGGSGGGNIAPTVSALGDNGWLLQWTEGAAGAYQVRLQRLDAKLEPLGEPRLVSPKGANAGQGAVFATGSRVLSVYIQTTAGHDELWGASFECK
jgi:hypothetical protein